MYKKVIGYIGYICDFCGEKIRIDLPYDSMSAQLQIKIIINRQTDKIEGASGTTNYDLCANCCDRINKKIEELKKENKKRGGK